MEAIGRLGRVVTTICGIDSMFFAARKDLTLKEVGGDLVLYDPANQDVHVLNASAARVFQLCDGSHAPEDIAKALVESFDGVEYDQACEDVETTLHVLETKHLVIQANC